MKTVVFILLLMFVAFLVSNEDISADEIVGALRDTFQAVANVFNWFANLDWKK